MSDRQDAADREEVARYGGSSGNFTAVDVGDGREAIVTREQAAELQHQGADFEAFLAAQQAAQEPAQYDDEEPWQEPSYPPYEELYPDAGFDEQPEPAQPPDPSSENYQQKLEQYVDQRFDERLGPYLEPPAAAEAWNEHGQDVAEAEARLAAEEEARYLAEDFPGEIAQALGNRAGSVEAAQMLAPAVQAVAEETIAQLLTDLVAEGYPREDALGLIAPHKAAIIKASVETAQQAFSTHQGFEQMRARARR